MEASCKEHVLEEIPVCLNELGDALRCILHSILFARAPGAVRPSEMTCDFFNITYARAGLRDVDRRVNTAVTLMKKTIQPLRICKLQILFFERQVKTMFLGFMSNEERSICEKWIIPISLVNANLHHDYHITPELEKKRRKQITEVALQNNLFQILSAVQHIEHMSQSMYEYEVRDAINYPRRFSDS